MKSELQLWLMAISAMICCMLLAHKHADQERRIKALEERQPAQPAPSPAQSIQYRIGEGQEPPAQEPDLA